VKLRVVFAGTPEFALPPLRALLDGHEVCGVLTQPDRPAGRGRALAHGPVKHAALERSVPVLQPLRLRGDAVALAATLAQLRRWQPDVIVVVAYGLMLPREVLELPRFGCLNIHASLLPRWRGAAPIARAIEAGDTESGVSIMRMEEGLDTGPVLLAESVPISATTTAVELHDALSALGARLILEALAQCAAGTARAQVQPAAGVTYARKLSREEAMVDWQQDAIVIDRRIRAFNPWPGAETRLHDQSVKLLRSRVQGEAPAHAAPGTVLGLEDGGLSVATGFGVLQLLELQRAGRRSTSARDFLNAEKSTTGIVFG